MPLTAMALTLWLCHEEQAPPVRHHTSLERMLEMACEGLTITPEQLCQELERGCDMPDLQSGAITPQALRLTARTLALIRHSGDALQSNTPNAPADAEARRQQMLAMLAHESGLQYAMTSDDEIEPSAVILTLGVRDKATCELRIPKDKYDGLALLPVIEALTSARP